MLLPHPAYAATITVTMTDGRFTPQNVTVNPGDTVTWVNNGSLSHTATADGGSFNSGTVQPGGNFSAVFSGTGTYAYHDQSYGSAGGIGMSGTVAVVSGIAYTNPNTNFNSIVGTPAVTANPSITQLQAEVQSLLAELSAIQTQGGATAATGGTAAYDSSSCPLVGRNLAYGASGDDVTRLQQFLARDPSVYPEGQVTGYYGLLTQAAVQRWQAKYNIVSSGDPGSTGYGEVGPRTAAAIALLCTTGSGGGGGGSTGGTVGGFISVTPVSGSAPLAVSITATVNTASSCAGANYTLDFGDNTTQEQISVPAGNCGQLNQTYAHTYQYGGTYQITLSSGAHQTNATVSVSGSGPPQIISGLPSETFNVSPVSGNAPLTVTFSGVVNSNDRGFCTGGCGSVLDFGDGSQGTVTLPATVGGWLNYSINHTYAQSGGYKTVLYQGGAGALQPVVGAATVTVSPTIDSLSASVSSGPAPLTVTFTGIINAAGSCTGGAYTIDYGDGQNAPLPYSSGSCQPLSFSVSHQYVTSGTFAVNLFKTNPASGSSVASASISVTIGVYSYGAPQVTADVSGNPLSVSVQFDLPSACGGYDLSWGDGTSDITQADTNASCAQTPATQSFTHAYATGGSYTIILKRGPTLSRVDDASITISN
jgi:plastocyanin/PKD repeat protein